MLADESHCTLNTTQGLQRCSVQADKRKAASSLLNLICKTLAPQTPGPKGWSCAQEPQRSTVQPIPSLCWIEGMRPTSSKGDGSTLPGTLGDVCENLLTKVHVEGNSRAESGQMHL